MGCEGTATGQTTFDADWVVTMAGPAIRQGRVVAEDGRIVAVGPATEVRAAGAHVRLGECVLMPGLVNAHCHSELSAYHGELPAGDFWTWLPALVAARRREASEAEQLAAGAAVRAMLQAGTTCVGNICRAAWAVQVLRGLPIRKVCYIELISGAISPPATIAQLRQYLDALPADDPLLTAAISPHTPYTVTREDVEACGQLARQRGLPLAIHLAETVEEVEWLRHGTGRIAQWHALLFAHPPKSPAVGPTEYALACLRDIPAALVHMNHADDWQRLCEVPAARRPAVVYCPRSHRFFGHGKHPYRAMLAAGVKVAIGTDSAASHAADETRPLSVLDEVRWLRREDPDMPAATLLEMATVHAAAAVGLVGRIGRLAAGYAADLVAFALQTSDIVEPIVTIMDGEQMPTEVYVAGRPIGGSAGSAHCDGVCT